jgi:hypothetical protein
MKEQQKQHLIDMMKADEELGLYEETISTEEDAKIFVDTIENPPAPNEKLKIAFEKQLNQETLEEAAREYYKRGQLGFEKASDTERAFLNGAKWQQDKNKYSKEEVIAFVKWMYDYKADINKVEELFEEFKK